MNVTSMPPVPIILEVILAFVILVGLEMDLLVMVSVTCSVVVSFILTFHCIIDIDECDEGLHECDPNAMCQDSDGSYNCSCKAGYIGDGRTCQRMPSNYFHVSSVY